MSGDRYAATRPLDPTRDSAGNKISPKAPPKVPAKGPDKRHQCSLACWMDLLPETHIAKIEYRELLKKLEGPVNENLKD